VPHETISLLVRWLHVAAMALALGGALLLWWFGWRPRASEPAAHGRLLLALAPRYEALFWLAVGLLVMTGVGNLGAFGVGLPAPASAWGQRLGLKLLGVLALLLFSLVRTVVIVRLVTAGEVALARAAALAPVLYAVTAVGLGGITLLAVFLAHA